ncbi:MAG: hypothetical protein EOL90_03930 [Spartobacteria bacterium]|nr:hypothetical protein [Spartobacteria bacterium]
MKKAIIWILISLMGWGLAAVATGAELGAWALTADGTGTTEESDKVTVGNFVGGAGIGAITYGPNGAYANSWTSGGSPDSTDYYEVTLSPEGGFGLVINQVDFGEYRSGTGIREFQVRISTNNFSSYKVLATNAVPDNTNPRSYSISDLNISVAEGNSFKLRFYGYLAEGSGGNWRINANSLKIIGTAMSLTGPPVFSFTPGSDVSVRVSNTLQVAVSILPSGSITSWWVDPSPAGTVNFAGGIFSYTPVAADFSGTNRLYMVANNAYGVTTGTLDIAVTEYLPPGTMEITFENAGEVKTSFDLGSVVLSGETWFMDQARIGDSALDVKVGKRAACFGSFYPAHMTSSNKLMPTGIGTISFLYAQYAGDEKAEPLLVEVATSTDPGDWLSVGRVDPNGVAELTKFETSVNINQPMYVRIRTDWVPDMGRANVDNIIITPYAAPSYSAYEQYLLQYNVTPGDAGTAPGEDWDGDGASNTNEFDADSNPYDAASVPP